MKMLVDVRKLSTKPSGVGLYTYNFLKPMIKSNVKLVLVSDVIESAELKELENNDIEVLCFGRPIDKDAEVYEYFRFIQDIINKIQPDVFWEPNNIIPIKLRNPYGKIMVTIHDIFPITSKKHYGFIYRTYFNFSIKRTIQMSDAIVYVSKETKNEVENRFKNSKNKFNFISYNIVEAKSCNELKIKDDNYFLYIGNLERRKGIDLLIKAFNLYIKDGGNKYLYIVGGLRDKTIKNMIDESNKEEEHIKYFGYINSEKKEKLLRECSAFIFPSRAEGFGIPPIEALIYKKPCIVSDINIFKEILGNSVNYFSISENESYTIINLKNKLINYSSLVDEEANEVVARYSSRNLTNRFIKFIEELC